MFVRQDKDGNWYVCRRTTKFHNRGRATKSSKTQLSKSFRNWFLVKYHSRGGVITTFHKNTVLDCPKRFIGKRVRLKLEVIEIPPKELKCK